MVVDDRSTVANASSVALTVTARRYARVDDEEAWTVPPEARLPAGTSAALTYLAPTAAESAASGSAGTARDGGPRWYVHVSGASGLAGHWLASRSVPLGDPLSVPVLLHRPDDGVTVLLACTIGRRPDLGLGLTVDLREERPPFALVNRLPRPVAFGPVLPLVPRESRSGPGDRTVNAAFAGVLPGAPAQSNATSAAVWVPVVVPFDPAAFLEAEETLDEPARLDTVRVALLPSHGATTVAPPATAAAWLDIDIATPGVRVVTISAGAATGPSVAVRTCTGL